MAVEIERKFLVDSDAWRADARESRVMRQAYLGGENCSIRVRIDGDKANLNIKSRGLGTTRLEYEYPVPLDDAQELLDKLSTGVLVEKTRHFVEHAGQTWEIDEFSGANDGLVVAEVELDSADQRFELPGWVGREVTHDERYYNAALAIHPYREWSAD